MENTNTGENLPPKKSKKEIQFQQSQKKDNHTNIKITSKVTGSNSHYFLILLNINGLNSPNKRIETNTLDMYTEPSILMNIGNVPQCQRNTLTQIKWLKNIFQVYRPRKQAEVAILISNKINFLPKVSKNDKEAKERSSKMHSQF